MTIILEIWRCAAATISVELQYLDLGTCERRRASVLLRGNPNGG